MRLKYGRRLGIADLIARNLQRFLPDQRQDILISAVPLHRWRIWSRGFNQSALIARALADLSAVDVEVDLLRRTKSTPPLRGMSGSERKRAVKDAFSVNSAKMELLRRKHVLLVDDVYTSGATANECARLLKANGAKRVSIYCWSRVVDDTIE